MFEIYEKDESFIAPEDEDLYYILASNGLFQVKKNELFTSTVLMFEPRKDKDLGWLEAHKQSLLLNPDYKKIPAAMIGQTLAFFLAVNRKFKDSEAIVLLYWSSEKQEYSLVVPKQMAGKRRLPYYEVGENPEGFVRAGDIHSHGNYPAFHSEVDQKDEEHDDGIHITFGGLDGKLTLSCSIVADGVRFIYPPNSLLDVSEVVLQFPPEWMDRVTKAPPIKEKTVCRIFPGMHQIYQKMPKGASNGNKRHSER